MMISCPACPKVYRIPAAAIPDSGREVRCSGCGTVWIERGIVADLIDMIDLEEALRPYGAYQQVEAPAEDLALAVEDFAADDDAFTVSGPDAGHFPAPVAYRGEDGGGTGEVVLPGPSASSAQAERAAPSSAPYDGPRQGDHQAGRLHVDAPLWSWTPALTVSSGALSLGNGVPTPVLEMEEPAPAPLSAAASLGPVEAGRRWLKKRLTSRRRQLDPGARAARRWRARFRTKIRNRLTPARAVGWSAWAVIVIVATLVVTDRTLTERLWPRTHRLYAALADEPRLPPVRLEGVVRRVANSTEGPVLEVRGRLVNMSGDAIAPQLVLQLNGDKRLSHAASISDVPLVSGGERPFVIRARLPEQVERIELTPSIGAVAGSLAPSPSFRMQQIGSGWKQSAIADQAPLIR
ncbi:hypothetical protein PB2503_06592 [Parvularcula bermudensis HTCC2503]|uniref:Zinc finger/thioredoxin putative domain-containing protein n=1 Tax=Parvularcula bermudensis (strain ATCC BAA-594 / HTCC2503 / KCTC 12087) TaxID=314260 RepID=E0TI45_PARBH|nr:zinc-ribbon domain-containing protein [Parvularcula bermudensis]ADM09384.1 hypothetical protein PB2503_06592 [Parvularcula bermudensis HTCC2503]